MSHAAQTYDFTEAGGRVRELARDLAALLDGRTRPDRERGQYRRADLRRAAGPQLGRVLLI